MDEDGSDLSDSCQRLHIATRMTQNHRYMKPLRWAAHLPLAILPLLDLVINRGQSAPTFLYLILLYLPTPLAIIMPIAFFFAALFTLHRLQSDSELVVMASAGYSLRQLAALIGKARPELSKADCRRRANDIDVVQNGVWLSSLLGVDRASLRRALKTCEEIAFGD